MLAARTRNLFPAMIVIAALSAMPIAVSQETPLPLERRVNDLEQLVQQLLNRLAQLEARLGTEPTKPQRGTAGDTSQHLMSWRKLKKGMSMDQVRAVLGEPSKVDGGSPLTFWYWKNTDGQTGSVSFTEKDQVFSWREPE
jgi:hypothetical protein